jgi:Tfp pilus assembly protein PilV
MLRRSTTIIEVVTAIVILSVALPALVSAFTESSRQTIFPSNAAVGSFLAIEKMEEIMARRYRGSDGYSAITTANFPAESPVSGFAIFNRSVAISYVTSSLAASGTDQGYKKVTVTVTWNDGGARTQSIEHVFADF